MRQWSGDGQDAEIMMPKIILKRTRQKKSLGQNPGTPKQKLNGPLSVNHYHTHSSLASIAIEDTTRT